MRKLLAIMIAVSFVACNNKDKGDEVLYYDAGGVLHSESDCESMEGYVITTLKLREIRTRCFCCGKCMDAEIIALCNMMPDANENLAEMVLSDAYIDYYGLKSSYPFTRFCDEMQDDSICMVVFERLAEENEDWYPLWDLFRQQTRLCFTKRTRKLRESSNHKLVREGIEECNRKIEKALKGIK